MRRRGFFGWFAGLATGAVALRGAKAEPLPHPYRTPAALPHLPAHKPSGLRSPLADGYYWISLWNREPGDGGIEASYPGYRRLGSDFVDGSNACGVTFAEYMTSGRFMVTHFGISSGLYEHEGQHAPPLIFGALTNCTHMSHGITLAVAQGAISVRLA